MTKRLGDIGLPYRHFARKREIFVIRGSAVDVWNSQTGNLIPTYFRALSIYIRGASLFLCAAPEPEPEPCTLNPAPCTLKPLPPVFSEEIENILDIPIGECYSNIIS